MAVKGIPVVIAENRQGFPVRPVEQNAPLMTVAESGFGTPITISDNGAPFIVHGLVPPWVPEGALFAGQPIAGAARYWRSGPPETVRESDALTPSSTDFVLHDPNVSRITDLGLYVPEGGRTNGVPNSSGSGAVVGVVGSGGALPTGWTATYNPGALQTEIVSQFYEKGLLVTRLRTFGTWGGAAAQINYFIQPNVSSPVASEGQTWAASGYIRLSENLASFLRANVYINELNTAGSFLAGGGTNFNADQLSDLEKRAHIRTLMNAGTGRAQFSINHHGTLGEPADFTWDIAVPQLELGPFATSPIITTGSPATRAADTVTLPAPAGTYDLHLLLDDESEEVIPGWKPDDPLPLDLPQGRFIVEYWGMEA